MSKITHFGAAAPNPEGVGVDCARSVSTAHGAKIANGGDFHNGVNAMTEVTLSPLALALDTFAKYDGKTATSAFAYMALAMAAVHSADNAEGMAESLIVDICDKVGARGKPTKDFPKGKANPNALKSNGYAGLAEAARLIRKIGKGLADNDALRNVVEGVLNVVQNEASYEAHKLEDKRVAKALEAGDEAKLAKAEGAYHADYMALTYPDRPATFAALRSAIDKATSAKGTAEDSDSDSDSDSEGEGLSPNASLVTVGDALANASLTELAAAFIAKLDDSDECSDAVAAITAAIRASADTAPVAKAA